MRGLIQYIPKKVHVKLNLGPAEIAGVYRRLQLPEAPDTAILQNRKFLTAVIFARTLPNLFPNLVT